MPFNKMIVDFSAFESNEAQAAVMVAELKRQRTLYVERDILLTVNVNIEQVAKLRRAGMLASAGGAAAGAGTSDADGEPLHMGKGATGQAHVAQLVANRVATDDELRGHVKFIPIVTAGASSFGKGVCNVFSCPPHLRLRNPATAEEENHEQVQAMLRSALAAGHTVLGWGNQMTSNHVFAVAGGVISGDAADEMRTRYHADLTAVLSENAAYRGEFAADVRLDTPVPAVAAPATDDSAKPMLA